MSDDLTLVSSTLLTYNRAKYLLEAIKSTANQTYADIEILISDNCLHNNP